MKKRNKKLIVDDDDDEEEKKRLQDIKEYEENRQCQLKLEASVKLRQEREKLEKSKKYIH